MNTQIDNQIQTDAIINRIEDLLHLRAQAAKADDTAAADEAVNAVIRNANERAAEIFSTEFYCLPTTTKTNAIAAIHLIITTPADDQTTTNSVCAILATLKNNADSFGEDGIRYARAADANYRRAADAATRISEEDGNTRYNNQTLRSAIATATQSGYNIDPDRLHPEVWEHPHKLLLTIPVDDDVAPRHIAIAIANAATVCAEKADGIAKKAENMMYNQQS